MIDITRMELVPGMIIGKDILNFRGEVIFPAGTKVDEKIIAKMTRYSVTVVSIIEDIDLATTYFEKIIASKGFKEFERWYNLCLIDYKNFMIDFVEKQTPINVRLLLQMHEKLESLVENQTLMLDYLYCLISNEDELTHTHCLNSTLIAGVFADWLVMSPSEKEKLIMCAFFYDIGKLKLPYDLLWKPDKLTDIEFATIKTHPILGYEIARTQKLDTYILNSILMHHERYDGSGYPSGLKRDQIDFYAQHIAIIDSYEAMTSPRAYRKALNPMQVIARFEQELPKHNPAILLPILKRLADSQIGLKVLLSDDSEWEIFVINPVMLSRPILKNEKIEFLNLSERTDLEIISMH